MTGVINSGQRRDEPGAPKPDTPFLERLPLGDLVVDRPEEVARYLDRHPDLFGTVERVARAVTQQLRGRAQLSLELHHDPEIRDQLLTLYVRQVAYDDDLLAVLEHIAEEQGVDTSASSGWFQLTTDFQPPGESRGSSEM